MTNEDGLIRGICFINSTCDTVGELTVNTSFAFVFANVAVSKSRHQILFYPTKERVKRIEKDLFEIF